jgi:hypothetical protein
MHSEEIMSILSFICLLTAALLIIKHIMDQTKTRRRAKARNARERFDATISLGEDPIDMLLKKRNLSVSHFFQCGALSATECKVEEDRVRERIRFMIGQDHLASLINLSSNEDEALNMIRAALEKALAASRTPKIVVTPAAPEQPALPLLPTKTTMKASDMNASYHHAMNSANKYKQNDCYCSPTDCVDWTTLPDGRKKCNAFRCAEVHCAAPSNVPRGWTADAMPKLLTSFDDLAKKNVSMSKKEGFCMEGLCGV